MPSEIIQSYQSYPPRGRLSWGAVLAGAVVAIGCWALLHAAGLALGLATFERGYTLRALGFDAGVWTLIVPIVALFVGALVAARAAGPVDRGTGVLHGATLWGLVTLLAIVLGATALSSLGQLREMAAAPAEAIANASDDVYIGAALSLACSLLASLLGATAGSPRRLVRREAEARPLPEGYPSAT